MTGFAEAGVGPMACANDWDQLSIPEFASDGDELAFSADRVGDDELDRADDLKDAACGVTMGIGYVVGALLLIGGAQRLARCCLRRRRAPAAKSAECNLRTEALPAEAGATAPQLVQAV